MASPNGVSGSPAETPVTSTTWCRASSARARRARAIRSVATAGSASQASITPAKLAPRELSLASATCSKRALAAGDSGSQTTAATCIAWYGRTSTSGPSWRASLTARRISSAGTTCGTTFTAATTAPSSTHWPWKRVKTSIASTWLSAGERVVTNVHDAIPLRHQFEEALPGRSLVHSGSADGERQLLGRLVLMHVIGIGPDESQLTGQPAVRSGGDEGLGKQVIHAGTLGDAMPLALAGTRRSPTRRAAAGSVCGDLVWRQAARAHREAKSSQNCSVSLRAVPSSR